MKSFAINFKAGSLDLDAIVTAFENNQKFKVEMVTDEPDPIMLSRTNDGKWVVINSGSRTFSDLDHQNLTQAIDLFLDETYRMRTIIILTDFSDTAFNAARYAASLASLLNTSCIILYNSLAVPLLASTPLQASPATVNSHQESIEKLNELKDKLQSLVSDQTVIQTRSDERSLISAVNTLVEQHRAGLVVMGITGKSSLEKTLIGSNTITVAKECSVPVLIIPNEATFKGIDKALFTSDLKEVSKTTPVRAIKTFIHTLEPKLFILNVDPNEQHLDPDTIGEQTDLHAQWDSLKPEYHYIDHEDIVEGIMQFADQHQVNLVITVPKKHSFFEGLFHRSLTKKLAFHTHTPLLLFKEDI